ncbi:hypothetical protein SEVIR_4G219101v4 [Setaria viridis]
MLQREAASDFFSPSLEQPQSNNAGAALTERWLLGPAPAGLVHVASALRAPDGRTYERALLPDLARGVRRRLQRSRSGPSSLPPAAVASRAHAPRISAPAARGTALDFAPPPTGLAGSGNLPGTQSQGRAQGRVWWLVSGGALGRCQL